MTPGREQDALPQLIRDAPDDDSPRLLYADWLADRGAGKRAELIRLQIALAALPTNDPRRTELAVRERELLDAHGALWAKPFAGLVDGWAFHRGFVEEVVLSAADFLANSAQL